MALSGLIDLPWWGYVLVTLALTHITIASVTIYLHRHQAHRALDLHPIPSHFFRFWLWFTTGMVTREWAAIHRKHHAKCETEGDPHSPQVLGIRKVLLEGSELYRAEAKNTETLERYGHGTPDDWIERNVYTKRSVWGVSILLILDVVLFGPIGLTMWAVQMLWIPVSAAGVINGIGHWWGYRNFAAADASRNIVPWGILIGGEELHNNHHAYATSAKLSNKWYEFDIGWGYIRALELLGLARVKKQAPRVRWNTSKVRCDADTLHAVITHRYDVVARFARSMRGTWKLEMQRLRQQRSSQDPRATDALEDVLARDVGALDGAERARLEQVVKQSAVLSTVFSMRLELAQVWQKSSASTEQLLRHLEDWCRRAEASGIAALRDFSLQLRKYA
jgi:stearoyl-CoA desaturase (delta-9 desaturase)